MRGREQGQGHGAGAGARGRGVECRLGEGYGLGMWYGFNVECGVGVRCVQDKTIAKNRDSFVLGTCDTPPPEWTRGPSRMRLEGPRCL